jgi:thiamine transporter ThiT
MKARQILRYGLAYAVSCGALWLFLHFVGRALYAFDSHQVFFWLYGPSAFCCWELAHGFPPLAA